MSGASTGVVVQREFYQDSVAFESVFAKIKTNTDIKIEAISAGWGWDPVGEGTQGTSEKHG